MEIKRVFASLPHVLQKQLLRKVIFSVFGVLFSVVATTVYHDFSVVISILCVSLISCIFTANYLIIVLGGLFVTITGECIKAENSGFINKHPFIYFRTSDFDVKIRSDCLHNTIKAGDIVTVYIAGKSPVYEENGDKLITEYLVIDVNRQRKECSDGQKQNDSGFTG